MSILRFIFFLIQPLLCFLAIPFLIVVWLILFIGLGLLNTWYRAIKNPKYDKYWDIT